MGVSATVRISILVYCPYDDCGAVMDLNTGKNYDFELVGEILDDCFHGKRTDRDFDVECPECGREFKITEIEY